MKRTFLGILVPSAMFIAIFNLLLFVIGDASEFTASVWISYAFIHFAFLVSVISPLVTSGKRDFARQSNSSYFVTGIYFGLAFVIGLIFILVAPTGDGGVRASWLIQVILFALFVIAFAPICMANSHTNEELARQGREARFIQDAASRIKLLRDSVTDGNIIAELDVLSIAISSSPIKSSPDVRDLEINLMLQISELEELVDGNRVDEAVALVKKINRAVKERNRILQIGVY